MIELTPSQAAGRRLAVQLPDPKVCQPEVDSGWQTLVLGSCTEACRPQSWTRPLSGAKSARTRSTQPAPRSERRSTCIESWVGRKAQRSDQSQGGASKDAEGGWGASIRSAAELSWKASPQTGVKPPNTTRYHASTYFSFRWRMAPGCNLQSDSVP